MSHNKVYRANLQINPASAFDYDDIDPPERDGYFHQIEQISVASSSNDTANYQVSLGTSIAVPVRSSFVITTDALANDLLTLTSLNCTSDGTIVREVTRDVIGDRESYVDELLLFQDTLRVFAAVPTNVAAGKTLFLAVLVRIAEVKITSDTQQHLLNKMYS